jgi:hypothetical protein
MNEFGYLVAQFYIKEKFKNEMSKNEAWKGFEPTSGTQEM